MHSYTLTKHIDYDVFRWFLVCLRIMHPDIQEKHNMTDVDGSNITNFMLSDSSITVRNDCEVDAVYVDSEIDISDVVKEFRASIEHKSNTDTKVVIPIDVFNTSFGTVVMVRNDRHYHVGDAIVIYGGSYRVSSIGFPTNPLNSGMIDLLIDKNEQ